MDRIYPSVWLALPKDVRDRLVEVFSITRTGATEIRDQSVVSDGYTVEDLQCITLTAMSRYIGSDETFGRAWEITIAKAHSELHPPVAIIKQVDGEPTAIDIEPVLQEPEDEMKKFNPELLIKEKALEYEKKRKEASEERINRIKENGLN